MELEPLIHPLVDICHGIMMPEFIGGGMGCVCLAPQQIEVLRHPAPVEMGVPYGREKVFPARYKFADSCIVSAHDLQHRVMQHDIMLVMAFGILYIQDALFKVHIVPAEQPRFIRTDPAAVKEPEKYGDSHLPYSSFHPVFDDGDMVTFIEKPAEFFLGESVGDIDPPFFPWDLRGLYGGQLPAVQETYKAVHNIDPGPAGIVCFRNPLAAPSINHFLGQHDIFGIMFIAVMVEQHQVLFIGRVVPTLRSLPVPYEMVYLRGEEGEELFHKENTSSARGKSSILKAHFFK